ncbi:hypothetical protein [Georgenia faecalis]|uniref:hypothetical protein n=1 Tax=Georgenia faecalis TaxID=2483799 RepID=UPI000FD88761|nr:hypothetical protein [Georgenia faecalis]
MSTTGGRHRAAHASRDRATTASSDRATTASRHRAARPVRMPRPALARAGRLDGLGPRGPRAVGAVLLGALVVGGVTGSAAALWSDTETTTGHLSAGVVSFAVGRVDGAATGTASPDGGTTGLAAADGPDDVLTVGLGPAEATTLVETGVLAVPIRVDAVAQGNLGLRYQAHLPRPAAGSVLAAARLALVRVPDAAGCTRVTPLPAAAPLDPAAAPVVSAPVVSTPVPAGPSTTADGATAPVTEYWCLVGRLDQVPVAGAYSNTGTVHADSSAGAVTSSDTWTARVAANPAAEPLTELTFTHETFRPGR